MDPAGGDADVLTVEDRQGEPEAPILQQEMEQEIGTEAMGGQAFDELATGDAAEGTSCECSCFGLIFFVCVMLLGVSFVCLFVCFSLLL